MGELNREVPLMRENSRKLRFETSMSSNSRGHVLAKVSHVGRITLRDMSALRVTVSFYCFSTPRVVQREMFESIPFIQNTQFLLRFSAQSGPAAIPSNNS